jgi:hypothetical protein
MAPARKAGVFFPKLQSFVKEISMAKFKCKHTGNVYEFLSEQDIETLREHDEYIELEEEEIEEVKPKVTRKQKDK